MFYDHYSIKRLQTHNSGETKKPEEYIPYKNQFLKHFLSSLTSPTRSVSPSRKGTPISVLRLGRESPKKVKLSLPNERLYHMEEIQRAFRHLMRETEFKSKRGLSVSGSANKTDQLPHFKASKSDQLKPRLSQAVLQKDNIWISADTITALKTSCMALKTRIESQNDQIVLIGGQLSASESKERETRRELEHLEIESRNKIQQLQSALSKQTQERTETKSKLIQSHVFKNQQLELALYKTNLTLAATQNELKRVKDKVKTDSEHQSTLLMGYLAELKQVQDKYLKKEEQVQQLKTLYSLASKKICHTTEHLDVLAGKFFS